MPIEYIELKNDQPNVFWNDAKPKMYLDENLNIALPDNSLYDYQKTSDQMQKHKRYSLRTFNKQNLILEFIPFASRKLRKHLNTKNNTKSQIPLVTQYGNDNFVYISHKNHSALLKISANEMDNDFLDIVDDLYEIN